jgi:hypothetical protein
MFQKEQERQERKKKLRDALHGSDDLEDSLDGTTRKRRGKAKRSRLSKEETRFRGKNIGVEERNEKDREKKELNMDDEEKEWLKKSQVALKKKAKIYEEMMKGNKEAVNAIGNVVVSECLVNFEQKQHIAPASETICMASKDILPYYYDNKPHEDRYIDIQDEFGRTRRVTKESAEYLAYIQQTKQKKEAKHRKVSDGSTTSTTLTNRIIKSYGEEDEDSRTTGSFVTSQWEKTLNQEEKMYLREISAATQSAQNGKKISRKEARLQKLLLKKNEKKNSKEEDNIHGSSIYSSSNNTIKEKERKETKKTNDASEAAAAVQATNFLSSLI